MDQKQRSRLTLSIPRPTVIKILLEIENISRYGESYGNFVQGVLVPNMDRPRGCSCVHNNSILRKNFPKLGHAPPKRFKFEAMLQTAAYRALRLALQSRETDVIYFLQYSPRSRKPWSGPALTNDTRLDISSSADTKLSFLELGFRHSKLKSSDKIYALLEINADPFMANFAVDYSLSDVEAYAQLVKRYIAQSQSLDILTYVNINGNRLGGPLSSHEYQVGFWIGGLTNTSRNRDSIFRG